MRLTLAGKIVLFLLGLAGLYFAWRQVPRRDAAWQRPRWSLQKRERSAPVAVRPPDAEASVEPHEGIHIGFLGVPPPATLEITRPGYYPNTDLAWESRQVASLKERRTVATLLTDVGSGLLDAAVVDFPSVVFAARKGRLLFHVVLLVSWRDGADVLVTRSGEIWDPTQPTHFEPGTSGEYMLRRVLVSGRYSPADLATGRERLARPDGKDAPAAAGRLDRLPAAMRSWPVVASTGESSVRMPDVLVVNTRWARANPEVLAGLLRGWLQGQAYIAQKPNDWKRFVRAEADRRKVGIPFLERSLRPASYEDQMAFAGLGDEGISYSTLVTQQMRTLEPGARPPDPEFTVPVDWEPLSQAAPLLVK